MKKTIITLTAAVLIIHAAYSQKAKVGFTAGVSFSNYKIKTDGSDESGNSKIGFTAGLIANLPIGKNFMIQTGANWVQKGTKDEEDLGGGVIDKVSLTVNSIEVPVNLVYNSGGFFIGAGPSISFAVSGKWKFTDGQDEVTVKTKFGDSDDDDMKGFDFGANILTGYQFSNGFLITANFNQGLSNLIPGNTDNSKLTSHYFGIRLGYLLNGKK